jgi:outer membrane protein assembly factor BamD
MTTRSAQLFILIAVAAAGWGCGASRAQVPPGTAEADKYLFTRGEEEFKDKNWVKAREYYRQIVDNYPQSPFRPDAKLAVGDSYIGEHSTESLLLAVNEFREFLTFYPTSPRADYAQYRMAYAYSLQMRAPERDQSNTRDVVKELQVFMDRYPNSTLMPDAKKLMREAKDRLSEASYRVGYYYFRVKWYVGAIDRFKDVLKTDPEYTHRDEVYFRLAEALRLTKKEAEALPYYERLVAEFEQSEHIEEAKKRIAELKAAQ